MNRDLVRETMDQMDQLWMDTIVAMFPGVKINKEVRDSMLHYWKLSELHKRAKRACERLPDEKVGVARNLLRQAPLEIRRQLRKAATASFSAGGRTPLLDDSLRREACEKVRTLQEQGFKLRKAMTDIAPLYGLTLDQLVGIWKHRSRYKDTA